MCRRRAKRVRILLVSFVAILSSAVYAQDPSLVLYFSFDDNPTDEVIDLSQFGNNGVLEGSPALAEGKFGGALMFDATDDQIVVPTDPTLDIENEITMMAWAKPGADLTADWRTIMGKSPTNVLGQNSFSYDIRTDQNGALRFSVNLGTWQYIIGPTLTQDTWYHIAGTYDGSQLVLYVDGEPVGTAEAAGTITVTQDPFCVGNIVNAAGATQNEYWSGVIDEVRLWDRALNPDEVAANMNQGREGLLGAALAAFGPNPRNGSMIEKTFAKLEWLPGDFAVAHQVYIGEDFNDVNEARVEPVATAEASLTVGFAPPYETGLTPGATYYWCVDEVNEVHPDSPWRGDVWSFQVRPAVAWNPSPADGAVYIVTDRNLSWEAGLANLFHTVYVGQSFEEVDSPTAGGAMIIESTFDAGPLDGDTTYFWRVDEFDGFNTYKGAVWSFTTVPDVAVSDPNLIVWWQLDEGEGATVVDWSGHGNHGSILGGPAWVAGYQGQALEFDGINDEVVRSLSSEQTLSAYSVATWVRAGQVGQAQYASVFNNNSNGADFQIDVDGTSPGSYRYVGAGGNGLLGPVVQGWVHLAVSNDGTNTALYYNGEAVGTVASTANVFGQFAIGVNRGGNVHFRGTIDDTRVYDKALTAEEIADLMRGDPLLAWDPAPGRDTVVDVREITSLSWVAGETAASHDVYLGKDRAAVAGADRDAGEYQGNQAGTSFSVVGLVELGDGDYYWRIDEVETDETTIHKGSVWKFTAPNYLIVEDFESYTDEEGNRVYETWIDGWTNNTGSVAGYLQAPFVEHAIVHGGSQSIPMTYDNTAQPYYSEIERTWTTAQDWTIHGVDTLSLHVHGQSDNDPAVLYVVVEDSAGSSAIARYVNDTTNATEWVEWNIPLSDFAGVKLTTVKRVSIGLGDREAPAPGGKGLVFVDDLWLTRP